MIEHENELKPLVSLVPFGISFSNEIAASLRTIHICNEEQFTLGLNNPYTSHIVIGTETLPFLHDDPQIGLAQVILSVQRKIDDRFGFLLHITAVIAILNQIMILF